MKTEKNKLIELTPSQQNPYLARPEDFEVEEPNAPAKNSTPGHGQHGDNSREYTKLLAESPRLSGRGQQSLPIEPGNAERPHTK